MAFIKQVYYQKRSNHDYLASFCFLRLPTVTTPLFNVAVVIYFKMIGFNLVVISSRKSDHIEDPSNWVQICKRPSYLSQIKHCFIVNIFSEITINTIPRQKLKLVFYSALWTPYNLLIVFLFFRIFLWICILHRMHTTIKKIEVFKKYFYINFSNISL